MLFSLLKKIQDGRHDVIIADFSKWFNLVEIMYKYSSYCTAYLYYVVFTLPLIMAAILIFYQNFVMTTPLEPQVVETYGFHHKV